MGKFSLLAALGVLALLAVAHAMPQSGTNSSSEEPTVSRKTMKESTRPRSFMSEIRWICRRNSGSDEAYIALTEAIGTAVVCVMSSVDVKHFISDIDTISNETRGTLLPKYCPQLKRAGSCLDDLVKAVRPCMHEADIRFTLALTGMYPDMIDMICKNDGEVIFTLAEPKTQECISELRDNVTECTLPFAVKSEDCDISNLTPTQVEAFSDLRQCIEGKLNVCAAPDLIRVYGVFHNALFRFNSCIDVHIFITNAFVPFVQYMSKVTKQDTNTV